ncbi:MAG TPA: carbon-nitrogen hydrolase family protein [Caulobacteraceae bacterium]|nr:carbon-nitrogen hydrolase family protein [Caulobacteraceae bacterium]
MTDSARSVRIAAAQTPAFREDLPGAFAWLLEAAEEARAAGARLLSLPEGFLQGYLTDEESARRHALDLASPRFAALLRALPEQAPMLVVGLIEAEGEALYNTAAVIRRQALVGRYRKRRLLARERCFRPGDDTPVFEVDSLRFGINICFDTNFPDEAARVARQGASLLVCAANNMLPEPAAVAWKDRHNPVRGERCRETGLWLMSADVTGRCGDEVAWGPTAVLNPAGEVVAQLPLGAPGLLIFDLPVDGSSASS